MCWRTAHAIRPSLVDWTCCAIRPSLVDWTCCAIRPSLLEWTIHAYVGPNLQNRYERRVELKLRIEGAK
jgi:hypothetical protein